MNYQHRTSGGGAGNYQHRVLGISIKHTCDIQTSGGATVNYQLKMLGISTKDTCTVNSVAMSGHVKYES